MENQSQIDDGSRVRATFRLGSESYSVSANKGTGAISEELASMKEQSMALLKEFITKHNAPNDVPDELVESPSEEEDDDDDDDDADDEVPEKPGAKSKKTKVT